MIKFGVIGFGYWGPKVVRNLVSIKQAEVVMICDENELARGKAEDTYPHIKVTGNFDDILTSDDIDVVAIVTPVSTHYDLAKKALENDKHVFVEKPFTATVKEAEELNRIAAKRKLMIMVDHTFIFTGAVKKIKEVIDNGTLGELIYYDSTRVSLGLFQHDVNVIWDLAPHDLSIIDYVLKANPTALTAHGADYYGSGKEQLAYITIYCENNLLIHLNVNWLSPMKVRSTLIGGTKKMLVWDDMERDEKIKIYDKGVDVENKEGIYELLVDYRSGDMWSPRIDFTEALKKELCYFVECIKNNESPINDGLAGLRVVKMLEMTDQSLKNNGRLVKF